MLNQVNHVYTPAGDREILEISEARVIYCTYSYNKDKEQVFALCRKAEKIFGIGSAKRILEYVKQMELGELE